MNDLHELGAHFDPPSHQPGPDLRRRLRSAYLATPRRRWSWAPRLAIAGGIATILAAALLVSQVVSVGDRKPASVASAADILNAAARAAAAEPAAEPRSDQYVYIETMMANAGSAPYKNTAWLSVDGTHDGLVRNWDGPSLLPGCRGGKQALIMGDKPMNPPRFEKCTPYSAYHKDVPTDPEAARKYLYEHSQGANPPDVQAFITLGDLLRSGYLKPAARAALLAGAAKIPGISLHRDAADLAGRKGVAVGNAVSQIIFDEKSHTLLGERSMIWPVESGPRASTPGPTQAPTQAPTEAPTHADGSPAPTKPSANDVASSSSPSTVPPGGEMKPMTAVLKIAIVDRVGQTG